MVLYKTFLSDDDTRMLRHVGKTINSDTHDITKYMDKDNKFNDALRRFCYDRNRTIAVPAQQTYQIVLHKV